MCPDLGLWEVLPAESGEQNCNLTGPALRPEKCDQRKREKAPKWDMCNTQRKVSSNSSQEPCFERESLYNRTALVISDPIPESPQPTACGRWVPHKLRGKTKLGVGFGAQAAPPQAKRLCPEYGSEPLRSETWVLPLLSEQQLQWATKRSLDLLKHGNRELEIDPQICNIPRQRCPFS